MSINAESKIQIKLLVKNFVYKTLNPFTVRLLASTGITGIVFATKLDLNQTKLDLNQTKLDLNQTKLDLNQTKLDLNQTKLDLNQTKLDLNQTKLDLNQTKLEYNQTKLEYNISNGNLLNLIYEMKSEFGGMYALLLRYIFHSNLSGNGKFESGKPTGEQLPHESKLVIDKGAGILAFPKYDTVMSDYITRHGVWEPSEQMWIRKNASPGFTVLNVGANIGVHSLVASKCVGEDGRVVAFECHPEIFLLLSLNLVANRASNTKAINIAIDEFEGSGRLYCSDSNSGDNRLVNSSELGATFFDITKIRLETYCEAENLSPEIVVMDIQGSELSAIRGLGDKLCAGGKILFEFTPSWEDPNTDVAKQQLQDILQLGYELRILDDSGNDSPITVEDVMSMFSANSDLLYLNLVLWKR
jgi:FkbM family methyltransferase